MEGQPSVVVSDEKIDNGHQVAAVITPAKYDEICAALQCAPGQVGQALLSQVQQQIDARADTEVMEAVREVRRAGKSAQLAAAFAPGGSLANLRKA